MRVVFHRWIDPSKVHRDDYPADPDDHSLVDLLDACAQQPFKPAGAFLSPLGIIPASPQGSLSEQFSLWVMHTDGRITGSVQEVVVGVGGVEVFHPWTPYRAWLGVGKLFDHEKVFREIEVALRGI